MFLRWPRHVASSLTLAVVIASCAFAQSKPPQPESGPDGTQNPAASDPRGTDSSPLIIKIQPTPKTDAEAAEEQHQKDQEISDRNWTQGLAVVTALLGLFQLIAIGFQVGIARRQNQIIEKQSTIMSAQRDAAHTQSTYMRDGLAQTKKAADAAKDSADVTAAMLVTNQTIERAYVTMSHLAPGVRRDDDFVTTGQDGIPKRRFSVHVRIQNHGNTPAMVTDIVLTYLFAPFLPPLPPVPDRGGGQHAFLVKGDSFDSEHDFVVLADDMGAVEAGKTMLFVLGYVDYVDQFGERRRSGYARWFFPTASEDGTKSYYRQGDLITETIPAANNLMVVSEPGYNYERRRRDGEGNDWGQDYSQHEPDS